MVGIIIALGVYGVLVFIFAYQLCLTLRRLNQAVVLPIALAITALFILGALEVMARHS